MGMGVSGEDARMPFYCFRKHIFLTGPAPGQQASVECVGWGAGRLYSCGLHGQVGDFGSSGMKMSSVVGRGV